MCVCGVKVYEWLNKAAIDKRISFKLRENLDEKQKLQTLFM